MGVTLGPVGEFSIPLINILKHNNVTLEPGWVLLFRKLGNLTIITVTDRRTLYFLLRGKSKSFIRKFFDEF